MAEALTEGSRSSHRYCDFPDQISLLNACIVPIFFIAGLLFVLRASFQRFKDGPLSTNTWTTKPAQRSTW